MVFTKFVFKTLQNNVLLRGWVTKFCSPNRIQNKLGQQINISLYSTFWWYDAYRRKNIGKTIEFYPLNYNWLKANGNISYLESFKGNSI